MISRASTMAMVVALTIVAMTGCLAGGTSNDDALAPTGQPADDVGRLETVPIDWEGNLGTWACAPMGPNACAGTTLGDQDSWHPVDPEGDGRSLALILTWQALSPLTEELSLTVAPYTSCGDGCYGTAQPYATVTGASPVDLELDDIGLEGEQLGYVIYVDGPLWVHEDPVLLGASHHQPFHVEGTLTTLVPAS